MSLRSLISYIFFFCAFTMGAVSMHAQSLNADSIAAATRHIQEQRDSANQAREDLAEAQKIRQQAYRDSMQDAREKAAERMKQAADSARYARQQYMDSMKYARQVRADSLAEIRKYRESRYYKDSVADFRKQRTDSIAAVRKAYFDSLKTARKKVSDSIKLARQTVLDSIHGIQKHRTDSLASIRKYRESKRFRDSVGVVKRLRSDSMQVARKHRSDSLIASRKKVTDSFAKQRKLRTDSLAGIRKHRTDSLTALRKVKTDSLAKAKIKREKNQKANQDAREKKQQLAFELKIKKKHQAYSNESMLKKGWGVPRQIVQNTFTRYNYFFNAERKMNEAVLNMNRVRKDNYDSTLALFPFDPDRDSATIAADMDSIIRKVSVGIQIHDPRTKWGDDLYLLLGQAYFYKGNYSDAASSFRYILSLKDKKKTAKKSTERPKTTKSLSLAEPEKKGMLAFMQHRSVHNESILWLARVFTQMKQEGNAESVLDLIDADPNFPKSLQGRLALEKAFIALHERDNKAAMEQLSVVAKDENTPNVLRMRAGFIAGQLQMNRGEYAAAAKSFDQVIDLYPKIEMDFYARKNLAYATMLAGGDQKDAIASLKKVLNDGKYAPYYEQVYYVLGRLAANDGDYSAAIKYLNSGLGSSKSTRKQKAVSFAALGNIYYKQGDYASAKHAYDSASAMASSAPNDSLVLVAMKRSSALNSITGPLDAIHMQDSLLALSALSSKDQRAEVRRAIRRLEQTKSDSAFKAENAAFNNASNAQNNTGNNMGGNTNAYANWYFANPNLMQQGMNEFKRKWGNRTLSDNWRRSIGSGFGNNVAQSDSGTNNAPDDPDLDERGLPTEESLLAYIPSTDEEKNTAVGKIKRAYMDLSTAYIKDLEDYPPAIRTLDTFDKKYPAHEYKAEALYLRYLVANRQNRLSDAQGYANQILQQYQDTKWADLVRPTESGTRSDTGQFTDQGAFYDETYDLLMQRQYPTVLARVQEAERKYPNTHYQNRFTILKGAAYTGNDEFKRADTLLNRFITDYPTDTLRPWAEALLKYIADHKPPPTLDTTKKAVNYTNAGPGTPSGQPPALPGSQSGQALPVATTQQPVGQAQPQPGNIPLPNQVNSAGSTAPTPTIYFYNANEPHFVMFGFGIMEARAMGVKAAITDFNTFKYSDQHLETEIGMLRPDRGIVVVKSFRNMQDAKAYMNALKAEPKVSKEYKPDEYQWILISSTNYDKLQDKRDLDAYLKFYNSRYK